MPKEGEGDKLELWREILVSKYFKFNTTMTKYLKLNIVGSKGGFNGIGFSGVLCNKKNPTKLKGISINGI